VQAADRGTTTGIASFHAKGDVTEYKAGVVVWIGKFFGVSITDARKGPLHNSGWDCTGESTIHDGQVHQSDGFCVVTDADGDVINLVWEQTHVPAPTGVAKTKGTYLSGTGKYEGIQGYYTFSCKLGGIVCNITAGDYRIP
jgi:predicted RecA/RadA family phage recombinase